MSEVDTGPKPLEPGPSDVKKEQPLVPGAPVAPEDKGILPNPEASLKVAAEKEAADKAAAEKAAADKKAEEDARLAALKAAETAEYVDTGSEAGNAVIAKLKAAGVTAAQANAIFDPAIQSGDFNKIDWPALEKLVSKEDAALIKAGALAYAEGDYKARKATEVHAYETLGGEAGWNKVRDYVRNLEKTTKDASVKEEIGELRSMLAANGYQAKVAIGRLKQMYEGDKNNSALTIKVERGNGNSHVVIAGEALGRTEYLSLMKKAQMAGNHAEIANLQARRRAGMQRGI